MDKNILLTGASSGIGRAILNRLLADGYTVYGVGRFFSPETEPASADFSNPACIKIEMDMTRTGPFYEYIRNLARTVEFCGLINNAGVGYYGLHETLSPAKIHEMVTVNLEVPMVLTQLLLRNLKKNQGHIIDISSVTARQSNPHGCAYGATKAGLTSFTGSLFDEARKYGVHVTAIHPDMVKTNLYRNADFCEGEAQDTYLTPEQVAEAVAYVLNAPKTMTVSDVTLRPQKHQIRKKGSSS